MGHATRLRHVSTKHAPAVLSAAARKFPPGNAFGVTGFVIAKKRREGRTLGYDTLRLYVDQKELEPNARVRTIQFSAHGERFVLTPDVIGIGASSTHPTLSKLNYTGLHHSAAIRVHKNRGATSVLLSSTRDRRPTHLITAGHLFAPNEPTSVHAAPSRTGTEQHVGNLELNLLDLDDQTKRHDGALVRLTPAGETLATATASRARPLHLAGVFPNARRTAIPESQMFRATTGDYSFPVTPERQAGQLAITDVARGDVIVRFPIVCPAIGRPGDSGGLLHESERAQAVGSYVGTLGILSVFESIAGLLSAFRDATGLPLRVWKGIVPLACALVVTSLADLAAANQSVCGTDACCNAALAHAETDAPTDQRVVYQDGAQASRQLRAGTGSTFRIYHVQREASSEDDPEGAPQAVSGSGCSKLFYSEYLSEAPQPAAKQPLTPGLSSLAEAAIAGQASVSDAAPPTEAATGNTLVDKAFALSETAEAQRARALESNTNSGTLDSAFAETAQILGQIVASKAANAAYQRARDVLLEGLECTPKQDRTTKFPATCEAIKTLRVPDLATSREALLNALLSDMASFAIAKAKSGTSPASGQLDFVDTLVKTTIAALAHANTGKVEEAARVLLAELTRMAEARQERGMSALVLSPDRAYTPLVVGVAALLRCQVAVAGGAFGRKTSACPVEEWVRAMYRELRTQLANSCTDCTAALSVTSEQLATRVAVHLILAAAPPTEDKSPWQNRGRLRSLLEVAFDSACFVSRDGAGLCLSLSPEPTVPEATKTPELVALAGARAMTLAAIENDTNSLLRDAALMIAWFSKDQADKNASLYRSFRLMGTILDYSVTYTGEGEPKSAEQLHEQRTKILESLVDEMTHRADRGGDFIVSLGGSLNVVGGVRVPLAAGSEPVIAGPFSLLLGFGLDWVAPRGKPGFHLELAPIDLGQYLAFEKESDSGVVVREPDPESLLAPTLVAGVSFGQDIPFVLGVTCSYSPSYRVEGATGTSGAVQLGANVGFYVPLFDIN